MPRPTLRLAGALCLLALLRPATLEAQAAPAEGLAHVEFVVLDPSGAAMPHAGVILVPVRAGLESGPPITLQPRDGQFAASLAPATYQVLVVADGFEASRRELRLAARERVRIEVRLALRAVTEALRVSPDAQDRALDPRGFSTFLSREQIDALPDDPEGLARALRDLAPPGAILRVDGFTGGVLPPKSQILSIRLPRMDSFAAQEHGGLVAFSAIDIVTRPGGGVLQGGVDATMRGSALGARHPLAVEKADEAIGALGLAFDGPIARDRMSFAAAARLSTRRDTTAITATLPGGMRTDEGVVQPLESLTISGRVTARLPRDQVLRVSLSSEASRAREQGVGGFNLRERAYAASASERTLRIALGGPVARRGFIESRVQLRWAGARNRSALEAPTIRVVDAFTSGGAQIAGGERSFELEAAADVDYAYRQHAWRAGFLLEAGRHAVRRRSNYLGTFVFPSLDAYLAGTPAFFTQRFGEGAARYPVTHGAVYLQDDYRFARSLLLSYGVRYELQSGIDDDGALLPRLSVTWSPLRTGRTTVRASAGLFREWIARGVFETTRLVDGAQQWDVRIANPGFPQPRGGEDVAPRERYLLDPDVRLPSSRGASLGVEQQAGALRLIATLSVRRNARLLRGLNLNPPVAGRRADETSGNVLVTRSDARERVNSLIVQGAYARPGRGLDLFASYALNDATSNTAGPFVVPAGGALEQEWGASGARHAVLGTATVRLARATLSLTPRWRSGLPYSLLLGDTDGDGFYDDRPPGVPRQGARTPSQWEVGARLAYGFRFGRPRERPPIASAGVDLTSARAGLAGGGVADPASRRFSLELFAQVQNATNETNVLAVSGLIGSPSFGRALAASPPRTVDLGLRFGF